MRFSGHAPVERGPGVGPGHAGDTTFLSTSWECVGAFPERAEGGGWGEGGLGFPFDAAPDELVESGWMDGWMFNFYD